jgi:hypothetical protein
MRPITLAVSVVVGLISLAFLVGAVPRWLYGVSLITAIVLVSVGLYRQRHVVVGGNPSEDIR